MSAFRLDTGALLRTAGLGALAFLSVGGLIALFGQNPVAAYREILVGSLGSAYGVSEVVVRMIPLVLCGLATALPARLGLLNVGAEGQLHAGALAATWGALLWPELPRAVALPWLVGLGLAGGALAALGPAVLRVRAGINETISTLLLNYVVVLLVEHMVRGPWRDPMSFNWPLTPEFADAARLGTWFGTRIHTGLWFALAAAVALYLALGRTRWGYETRVIGDNAEAARQAGIALGRHTLVALCVGGALAGLAGMAEVSGVQGRLRPGISTGFGYTGFLASWLAGHHPLGVIAAAALLGILSVGGDLVQISLKLPYATVNLLMALIFFAVLARGGRRGGGP